MTLGSGVIESALQSYQLWFRFQFCPFLDGGPRSSHCTSSALSPHLQSHHNHITPLIGKIRNSVLKAASTMPEPEARC